MNIGADAQIQKQWSKRKMRLILGLTFEFDKVAIELILKIKIAIEDWIEQKKNWKLIRKFDNFWCIFLLNETTRFVQNNVVSLTIH